VARSDPAPRDRDRASAGRDYRRDYDADRRDHGSDQQHSTGYLPRERRSDEAEYSRARRNGRPDRRSRDQDTGPHAYPRRGEPDAAPYDDRSYGRRRRPDSYDDRERSDRRTRGLPGRSAASPRHAGPEVRESDADSGRHAVPRRRRGRRNTDRDGADFDVRDYDARERNGRDVDPRDFEGRDVEGGDVNVPRFGFHDRRAPGRDVVDHRTPGYDGSDHDAPTRYSPADFAVPSRGAPGRTARDLGAGDRALDSSAPNSSAPNPGALNAGTAAYATRSRGIPSRSAGNSGGFPAVEQDRGRRQSGGRRTSPRTAVPEQRVAELTSRRAASTRRREQPSGEFPTAYGPAAQVRDAVLRTTDLVKVYGRAPRSVVALDGVTMDVQRGRFTAIMGASGSGKSTLLHCLAGLDSPTHGQVLLGTTDLTRVPERKLTRLRRDRIGFVFQSYDLLPQLTARQNIVLPIEVAGGRLDQLWLDTVIEALELGDLLRQLPAQLSGGEQQRVAVARAVLSRPDVVLADEPTGALDAGTTREMVGFLRASVDHLGQTVVMVTHDPLAAQHTDRALMLHEGRLAGEVAQPSPHAVLDALSALADTAGPATGTDRRGGPPSTRGRPARRAGFRWPALRRRAARHA
jgi:putative ABC transport system ATP-binding protein